MGSGQRCLFLTNCFSVFTGVTGASEAAPPAPSPHSACGCPCEMLHSAVIGRPNSEGPLEYDWAGNRRRHSLSHEDENIHGSQPGPFLRGQIA